MSISETAARPDGPDYLTLAGEIVAAYVRRNAIRVADLPNLIVDVHQALRRLDAPVAAPQAEPPKPAVPVRKSVTDDYVVCLEDGHHFKSLRRHLRTSHDMTPEEYRAKWGLAADHPIVAPKYARARSDLARTIGLGQRNPG